MNPYAMFAGNCLHIRIAETALGKPLPDGAEVHHVDGDRLNNDRSNLVVCQDNAYHKLLHIRTRALKACGNPNWRKCTYCQEYDAPENLIQYRYTCHRTCHRLNSKRCRERRKNAA